MSQRALWASGIPWESPLKVSVHHYARLLAARGWEILFVTYPVSPLHLLRMHDVETRYRCQTWWQRGRTYLDGRLTTITPATLFPPAKYPLLQSEWVLNNWQRWTWPGLVSDIRRRGFGEPDLLVIDSVVQWFWLTELKPQRSLLRITDNIAGMPWATPAALAKEEWLIRGVDMVSYTARAMEPRLKSLSPRGMTYTPHGVETARFLVETPPMPDDLAAIPGPRAVFVGALAEWFDVEFLAEVAKELPGVSFVLIGPAMTDLRTLAGLPNVHCLGRRPYETIPAYLSHCDVGLIPFRRSLLVEAVNPVKLFEYFASGLPVVATRWEEIAGLGTPAILCDTISEFAGAISSTLAQPADKASLRALAHRADWSTRFAGLVEALRLGECNDRATC